VIAHLPAARDDFVASTIVGATREDHLDDILSAAERILPAEALTAIDAVSRGVTYPMG